MNVGRKIRIIREIRGYTQEYMAIQLEISQATYCRIENESTKIDLAKITYIAGRLDTDIISLLQFDDRNINQLGIATEDSSILFSFFSERLKHLELKFDKLLKAQNIR